MASVFTKKYHRPRTTTLRDFFFRDLPEHPRAPRRPRVLSPTRRCNPHPTGLVYQSSYNKHNLIFGIWDPNFIEISRRMPDMARHLGNANFTCGPTLPAIGKITPPDPPYTLTTTTRLSYQSPSFPPSVVSPRLNTSRFGYTPFKTARGIVPNTLPNL